MAKVDQSGACWLWTAALSERGYGFFKADDGRMVKAHRWSYDHFNGPIPPGLLVCHTCDVRRCVRPDHLITGTQKENLAGMVARGRLGRRSEQARVNGRIGLTGAAHQHSKLSAAVAQLIREEYANGGVFQHELAERYGVSRGTIVNIVRNRYY